MPRLNVLITGRSRDQIAEVEQLLADRGDCAVEVRVIVNGHVDPLQGLSATPDLLLLCDLHCEDELKTLIDTPPERRPALVVFGPGDDAAAVRLAMRAGARDYLTTPLDTDELGATLNRLADELTSQAQPDAGDLHVFINGKGGSGATFLATNVAHGLASSQHRVTLVDLDLQFAGLCRYLDISPERDLVEAIDAVDGLDEVAAEAFTSRHDSGLRLLASKADKLRLNDAIPPERVITLLETYRSFNDFVIVDLPRHIDHLSAAVLETADRISVVMQQSFPHLHDTARLLQIMRDELGIPGSKLNVVVNRYDKDSAILLKDIENALHVEDIFRIPNHYRLTTESVNAGLPLTEVTNKGAVVRGVRDYYQRLSGGGDRAGHGATSALQSLFRR